MLHILDIAYSNPVNNSLRYAGINVIILQKKVNQRG
jgi:antirestriction protein ArdC